MKIAMQIWEKIACSRFFKLDPLDFFFVVQLFYINSRPAFPIKKKNLGLLNKHCSLCLLNNTQFSKDNLWYQVSVTNGISRYTNADVKISLHVWIHLRIIPWKFYILNLNKSRVIYPQSSRFFLKIRLIFNILCCFGMFVNKHFIYLGRAYLRK